MTDLQMKYLFAIIAFLAISAIFGYTLYNGINHGIQTALMGMLGTIIGVILGTGINPTKKT